MGVSNPSSGGGLGNPGSELRVNYNAGVDKGYFEIYEKSTKNKTPKKNFRFMVIENWLFTIEGGDIDKKIYISSNIFKDHKNEPITLWENGAKRGTYANYYAAKENLLLGSLKPEHFGYYFIMLEDGSLASMKLKGHAKNALDEAISKFNLIQEPKWIGHEGNTLETKGQTKWNVPILMVYLDVQKEDVDKVIALDKNKVAPFLAAYFGSGETAAPKEGGSLGEPQVPEQKMVPKAQLEGFGVKLMEMFDNIFNSTSLMRMDQEEFISSYDIIKKNLMMFDTDDQRDLFLNAVRKKLKEVGREEVILEDGSVNDLPF